MKLLTQLAWFFAALLVAVPAFAHQGKLLTQDPSPMVEYVRAHERIPKEHYTGYQFEIRDVLPKPIVVYVPLKVAKRSSADLLIHFHGNANVVDYAAEHYNGNLIAVTIFLGEGSHVYSQAFANPDTFNRVLAAITSAVQGHLHHVIRFNRIVVSAWSAGYGAVRAILGVPGNVQKIEGVLLLDALYGSYVPKGLVLAKGGKVDGSEYVNFIDFCRLAVQEDSSKKFLFTYSEIFPGTFVSTAESAHYLLTKLQIPIHAVLEWGPLGMQQIADAKKGHFEIMGFAGNSAPDHVDHFEALYYFLNHLQDE